MAFSAAGNITPEQQARKKIDMMLGAAGWVVQSGRFTGVDMLAEKYGSYSPYHYTLNDPVNKIDPTGMDVEECIPMGNYTIYNTGEVELNYVYYLCDSDFKISDLDVGGGSGGEGSGDENTLDGVEHYRDECKGLQRLYQLNGFGFGNEVLGYMTNRGFLVMNSKANRAHVARDNPSYGLKNIGNKMHVSGQAGRAIPGGIYTLIYSIHSHPSGNAFSSTGDQVMSIDQSVPAFMFTTDLYGVTDGGPMHDVMLTGKEGYDKADVDSVRNFKMSNGQTCDLTGGN